MSTPVQATGLQPGHRAVSVVLMRFDPLDVALALRVGRATLGKMRHNLGWAFGYNTIALPIAAGAFAWAGLTLRPEIAALSMSGSSFLVAVNALLLRRPRLPQPAPATAHTPVPAPRYPRPAPARMPRHDPAGAPPGSFDRAGRGRTGRATHTPARYRGGG